MIRGFVNFAKKSAYTAPILFKPTFNYAPKFSFATQLTQAQELRYLARIVGTAYFKHNDEVNVSSDVRLVDQNNKFLGIYSVNEAKKKCRELNTDLVLINDATRPAICKATNYKDDLYKKFVKDILEKDLIKLSKQIQKKAETSKSIKLGSKMTISDLKNKIIAAQGVAKQVKIVRVYMQVTESTEESGRNILYTFRDLGKDFLRPRGEIEERELDEEEDWKKEMRDEHLSKDEDRKVLIQSFHSFLYVEQSGLTAASTNVKDLTEAQIKDYIQDYIKRESKKSVFDRDIEKLVKSGDRDVRSLVAEDREAQGFVDEAPIDELGEEEESSTQNLDAFRFREADSAKKANEKFRDAWREIEKADPDSAHQLNDEIEEIRQRFGGDREQAFLQYALEKQNQQLKTLDRLKKIKKIIQKNQKFDERFV